MGLEHHGQALSIKIAVVTNHVTPPFLAKPEETKLALPPKHESTNQVADTAERDPECLLIVCSVGTAPRNDDKNPPPADRIE